VDVVAALVALGPVLGMLVLLVLRTRQLWPRRPVTSFDDRPQRGGDTAGDREPRRPLTPVGAGSIALPLPEDDDEGTLAEAPWVPATEQGRRGLRAS